MQSWRNSAVAVFSTLSACSSGESRGGTAGPVIRDSAGVQIVENTAPRWREGQGWTVVDSPLVDIGGKAGDPAYDLAQVGGVLLLPGGRLVVAVGGAYQVRFYNADGTHLATAGQRGNGPGEYQGFGGLWLGTGDSVLVSDLIARRLTILSDSGKLGRSFSLGGQAGVPMPQGGRFSFALPAGTFRDGHLLAMQQGFRVNDATPGAYRDSADYLVYTSGGVVLDTVGRFPGIEMEQMTMTFGGRTFSAPSPVPLGKNTIAAVAGDRFVVAKNDAWEMEVRSASGQLQRIVRLHVNPRPITADDQTAHRKVTLQAMEDQPMLRSMPSQIKQQMNDRVNHAVYPKTFPFIAGILPATDGSLWVYEQATPGDETRVFTVFDSTGALLGRVTFPDRFLPTFITGDRVAGSWKDADDVEHARVYAIRKN